MKENSFVKIGCFSSADKFMKTQVWEADENARRVHIWTVKNRHEAFQIVMCTDRRTEYFVEVSDLTDEKGNTIGKENMAVYKEDFVPIVCNYHANGYPLGEYPDVLFPWEAVKARGENVAEADENEILYVEIKTPKDVPMGTYKGKIVVTAGYALEISVCLHVLDVTLTDDVTYKSLFYANADMMAHFEEDKSQETYDLYNRFLIEHRLGSTELVPEFQHDDEGIARYADVIYDYVVNRGLSFTNIPSVQVQGVKPKTYDKEYLKKYLRAILEKCLATQTDLFKKLAFFNWCIDEPFCWEDKNGRVYNDVKKYEEANAEVRAEFSDDPRAQTKQGKKILYSMEKISHVITDYYERKGLTPAHLNYMPDGARYYYDVTKISLCPKFDGLDTAELRKDYEGGEKWWYNCGTPNSPAPAYHIDEVGYAPRILAWMMWDYGVVGNLYWSVNNAVELFEDGTSSMIKDPYAIRRGMGCNGDGTLIYPGKPYGVKGPIASLRIKGIRDGYEDYELLRTVEIAYQKAGKDFKAIYQRLVAPVYCNVRIDAFQNSFDLAKKAFYALCLLAVKYGVTLSAEFDMDWRISVCGNVARVWVDGIETVAKKGVFFTTAKKRDGYVYVEIHVADETISFPLYVGKGIKVLLNTEWENMLQIDGYTEKEYVRQEGLNQTSFHLTGDRTLTLTVADELLSGKSFAFILICKGAAEYAVSSGGKTLQSGAFEIPQNPIVGAIRRVELNPREIMGNTIKVAFSENKEVGLREFYVF